MLKIHSLKNYVDSLFDRRATSIQSLHVCNVNMAIRDFLCYTGFDSYWFEARSSINICTFYNDPKANATSTVGNVS